MTPRSLLLPALVAAMALAPSPVLAADEVPAAAAPAPDPAELAEARAIIAIIYPPDERQQMIETMLSDLNAQIAQGIPSGQVGDPGLQAIIDEFMAGLSVRQTPMLNKHIPALLDAMAVAYANEFSLAELQDIRGFAQTPSGTRFLSRSTAIVGDPAVAAVNSALMSDAVALSTTMLGELRQKVVTYLNEHPDVAAKLAQVPEE